jgi:hypothetical protein
LFLALAHQRLGHGVDARQWLHRATHDPSAGVVVSWRHSLERRLLRAEAEALLKGAKP